MKKNEKKNWNSTLIETISLKEFCILIEALLSFSTIGWCGAQPNVETYRLERTLRNEW